MKMRRNENNMVCEKSLTMRGMAVFLAFCFILSIIFPLDFVMPVKAATDEVIPEGAYEFSSTIQTVKINTVNGGVATTTTTEDGVTIHQISANTGSTESPVWSNDVSLSMTITYKIKNSQDLVDSKKPYIYLKIPKNQLEILLQGGDETGKAVDNTKGWATYKSTHHDVIPDDTLGSGTYTIYPTENDEFGYIVIEFNQEYLDYIKSTTTKTINGDLTFDGQMSRDASQDGDKELSLGNVKIKVDFESKNPSITKSHEQALEKDAEGYPIITWKIKVTDLYALNDYVLSDDMLANAFDFNCQYGVYRLENGKLVHDEEVNTFQEFTITYKTKVTKEQLIAANDAKFSIENTAKLNDMEVPDSVEITPDSAPTMKKSGTPDYEYDGDRQGEKENTDYIYWTINVDRNYGLSLGGYSFTENDATAELMGAKDQNGTVLDTDSLLPKSGQTYTFKEGIEQSHVVLTFRTEVTANSPKDTATGGIVNTITFNENTITSDPPVEYDKKAQHTIQKTGTYTSTEDAQGNPVEYIDWTIVIDATINPKSNETINGYTIDDAAFVAGKYTWVSAEAKNNYQQIAVDAIADLFDQNGTTLTIKKSLPDMDYLRLTYRVALDDCTLKYEDGTAADRANPTGKIKAVNEFTVNGDEPGTGTVTDIPGKAGKTTVTVNKSWNNKEDTLKGDTTAKLTLMYRVQKENGFTEWAPYLVDGQEYYQELKGDQQWGAVSFTDLPVYQIEGESRYPIYYKVEEKITVEDRTADASVTIPENVEGLYTAGGIPEGGIKATLNPNFSLTNTWNGVNVTGYKYWRDDEDVADQRSARLVLQKKVGDTWVNVGDSVDFGKENGATHQWVSLPKYDESGSEIVYRVWEETIPAGYTAEYNGNQITNVYDKMWIAAQKNWIGAEKEDQPENVVMQLYRTTGDYNKGISSWEAVGDPITLNKADYDRSAELLKWTNLDKKDASGNVYYYKIVELQTTAKQKEFTVSYDYHDYTNTRHESSGTVDVTNTWLKTNITATKEWLGDNGYERQRPPITFHLQVSKDGGQTWDAAEVNDATVVLKNDGNGKFSADGSQEVDQYTWHGLETGTNIQYRVVEDPVIIPENNESMHTMQRGTVIYKTLYDGNQTAPVAMQSTDQNHRNVKIQNQSDMISIKVDKVWKGVSGEDIPEKVTYQLQYTTTPEIQESWTKFSDKTVAIVNGSYPSTFWTWMSKTDKNGNPYYYRVIETKVEKTNGQMETVTDTYTDESGQQVVVSEQIPMYDNVTMQYESEVLKTEDGNGNLNTVVTNTWKNMNVSIRKQWETGSKPDAYQSVTMRLMQKVGADGTWEPVSGKDNVTVTKANSWRLENAWKLLPKTDEQGRKIYYRAEEVELTKTDGTTVNVADCTDFYSVPDALGINESGDSVVTNVPQTIDITMNKVWDLISDTAKPYTVSLKASVGNAPMQNVDELKSSYPIFNGIDGTKNFAATDATFTWKGLPTRTADGATIAYMLEEAELTGFSADYSNGDLPITTPTTVTITNIENAPYTKQPANWVPSIRTTIETKDRWNTGKMETGITSKEIIKANDGILQNGTISSDKLSSVDTVMVNIGGQEVECYLFKWRIDLLYNQAHAGEHGRTYRFTDTLNDGSVFYTDGADHGFTVWHGKYSPGTGMYNADWQGLYDFSEVGSDNNGLTVTVDPSKTEMEIVTSSSINYFTYYTATPKAMVDSIIDETGEFRLTNTIKEKDEKKPEEIDLIVNGGDETGYIDKINKTADGVDKASGLQRIVDGTATYVLDVNRDGKYLSSGEFFTVTDKFHMLEFTTADGTKYIGNNIPLKAQLKNVRVYAYDSEGKSTLLDPSLYSYSVEKNPSGEYTRSEDYSDRFTSSVFRMDGNGVHIDSPADFAIPAGLIVIINYHGTPNAEATIPALEYRFNNTYRNSIDVSASDTKYDSSGNILVTLTFKEEIPAGVEIGNLQLSNYDSSRPCTVKSAVLEEKIQAAEYITKFTLPDGAHYEISYQYIVTDENDVPIPNNSPGKPNLPEGALVIGDNSKLTLHNEAEVETSNGKKSDESAKTQYSVQHSNANNYTDDGFEVVKTDIGNQSIGDLNAEFKFAKFDPSTMKWIYAESFPFRVDDDEVSEVEHTIEYGNQTDEDGNIPEAGNMILSGSFNVRLLSDTLYKLIEVKAPDNRADCYYPPVPYQDTTRADRTSLAANSDNTYYFVLNTSSEKLAELKERANVSAAISSVTEADSSLTIYNTRLIDIGAKKVWEQDPDSAVNTVKVAVQLFRSESKDLANAALVENHSEYLAQADKTLHYDAVKNAYILEKKNGAWEQEAIWHQLPNGNPETKQPYYYFVKEVGYSISDSDASDHWYMENEEGRFIDSSDNVYKDAQGNDAQYRPSYTDDGISSSGMVRITNSRKLIIKKEWRDINGNPLNDIPVNEVEFTLYGVTSDGARVPIILPSNKLAAPNWEVEIPANQISDQYTRFLIVENTELEEFIVSDVYALNGNVGVIKLINKNTNPTSVDVQVQKAWGDGNDLHGEEDAVRMTLYQYTGSAVVNDAFVKNFIENNSTGSGIKAVTGITNPVTLGTINAETNEQVWQAEWKNLPFKDGNKKIQYFVTETQSDTTKDTYTAVYTLDGNTKYSSVRTLTVTNKEPGALIVRKQWRDKTLSGEPLIPDPQYDYTIHMRLYRKQAKATQVVDADAESVTAMYGLTNNDLVTGRTDITGLSVEGILTLNKDNHWTVSLKGLDEGYCYYVEEIDSDNYSVDTVKPPLYTNEGQTPGSDLALTVDNYVEGKRITISGEKLWTYPETMPVNERRQPSSISVTLEQYASTVQGTPESTKTVTVKPDEDGKWYFSWDNLPASKTYRVVEAAVDGWTTGYSSNYTNISKEDTEVQITNTLDTGKVKVDKTWYENETGDNTSVTVGLYRKAYNADGTEYRETDGTKNAPKRFSMNSGMISLHKVQNALTQTDEPQDAENLNESEEDAQTTVPSMKQMPRFSMNPSMQVLAGAAQAYTDDVTGLKYIKLSEIGEISVGNSIGLESDLSGKEISKIVIIKDTASANGQIDITSIYQKITTKEIDGTWVTGPEPTEGVYSLQYGNNMYNNTTTVEITPQALPVGQYDGYTSYSNPLKSIVLNQNWSGSVLDVYFYFTPKGPTVQITQPEDQTNLTAVAGDTVPLVGTTSDGTLTWSADPAGAVIFDSTTGETVNATFKATGDVTITLNGTDDSGTQGEPVSVTYQVSAFKINDNQTTPDSRYTITEGETPTLTANGTGDTTWAVTEGGNLAEFDGQSGALTVNGTSGNFTVTATHGGVTDTMYFTIKSKPLSIEGAAQMHKGMTADLTAKANGEGVAADSWESSDHNVVTVDANGNITAHGTGTATITAMRGDATATHSVEVLDDMKLNLTGGATTSTKHSMSINDSWTVPLINQIAGIAAQISDPDVAEYRDGKIYTNTTLKDNVTITLTDMDGSGNTVTITLTVKMQEKVVDTAGAEHVCDLNISSTGWTAQSQTNLPLTDGMGHYYRYFIAEKYDDTANYIPISYAENDKQLVKDSVTVLALENYTEETESSSSTLPETGGRGTAMYYTIGGLLLMLGAVGYVTIKRRRWLDG